MVTKKKNRPRKNTKPTAIAVVPAFAGDGKKKAKKCWPRARTAAVLVKRTKDASYENVLINVRAAVKPKEVVTEIRSIRRTHRGEVLLELSNTIKADRKPLFSEAVRGALG